MSEERLDFFSAYLQKYGNRTTAVPVTVVIETGGAVEPPEDTRVEKDGPLEFTGKPEFHHGKVGETSRRRKVASRVVDIIPYITEDSSETTSQIVKRPRKVEVFSDSDTRMVTFVATLQPSGVIEHPSVQEAKTEDIQGIDDALARYNHDTLQRLKNPPPETVKDTATARRIRDGAEYLSDQRKTLLQHKREQYNSQHTPRQGFNAEEIGDAIKRHGIVDLQRIKGSNLEIDATRYLTRRYEDADRRIQQTRDTLLEGLRTQMNETPLVSASDAVEETTETDNSYPGETTSPSTEHIISSEPTNGEPPSTEQLEEQESSDVPTEDSIPQDPNTLTESTETIDIPTDSVNTEQGVGSGELLPSTNQVPTDVSEAVEHITAGAIQLGMVDQDPTTLAFKVDALYSMFMRAMQALFSGQVLAIDPDNSAVYTLLRLFQQLYNKEADTARIIVNQQVQEIKQVLQYFMQKLQVQSGVDDQSFISRCITMSLLVQSYFIRHTPLLISTGTLFRTGVTIVYITTSTPAFAAGVGNDLGKIKKLLQTAIETNMLFSIGEPFLQQDDVSAISTVMDTADTNVTHMYQHDLFNAMTQNKGSVVGVFKDHAKKADSLHILNMYQYTLDKLMTHTHSMPVVVSSSIIPLMKETLKHVAKDKAIASVINVTDIEDTLALSLQHNIHLDDTVNEFNRLYITPLRSIAAGSRQAQEQVERKKLTRKQVETMMVSITDHYSTNLNSSIKQWDEQKDETKRYLVYRQLYDCTLEICKLYWMLPDNDTVTEQMSIWRAKFYSGLEHYSAITTTDGTSIGTRDTHYGFTDLYLEFMQELKETMTSTKSILHTLKPSLEQLQHYCEIIQEVESDKLTAFVDAAKKEFPEKAPMINTFMKKYWNLIYTVAEFKNAFATYFTGLEQEKVKEVVHTLRKHRSSKEIEYVDAYIKFNRFRAGYWTRYRPDRTLDEYTTTYNPNNELLRPNRYGVAKHNDEKEPSVDGLQSG